MSWAKPSDDDPHGIQKLLSLLRTQQDGQQSPIPAPAQTSSPAFTPVKQHDDQANISTDAANADLRYVSFAQVLPQLSLLSKQQSFLEALLELKANQDRFEAMLASERKDLAASLVDDLQSSDVERQRVANERLRRWDREALGRWDWLYASQQEMLQQLGVPSFFATRDAAHVRRQQRVFDVLAGLLE